MDQRILLVLEAQEGVHSIIEFARRYSKQHDTSISHLVGEFLASLPGDERNDLEELTPTVRRLLGVAKGGPDRDEYRKHLLKKHLS